jgi:tRNA pseudouridine38-40 synthase
VPNYVVLLSFVGTNFHGWQLQPGLRTVQGELKAAIEKVFREQVKLIGCCRTDAGVHAREYVANFKASREMDSHTVLKALNSLLPADIGIKKVWIEEGFNARYSVRGKVYTYRILNSHQRDAFLELFCWRVVYPLDRERIKRACSLFIGRHDFSGFAKLEDGEKNPIIDIEDVNFKEERELIEISIRARSFLRYMVRRIVGSLVQLGLGKLRDEDIRDFLDGKRACPYTAKAKGLTLERIIL